MSLTLQSISEDILFFLLSSTEWILAEYQNLTLVCKAWHKLIYSPYWWRFKFEKESSSVHSLPVNSNWMMLYKELSTINQSIEKECFLPRCPACQEEVEWTGCLCMTCSCGCEFCGVCFCRMGDASFGTFPSVWNHLVDLHALNFSTHTQFLKFWKAIARKRLTQHLRDVKKCRPEMTNSLLDSVSHVLQHLELSRDEILLNSSA